MGVGGPLRCDKREISDGWVEMGWRGTGDG